MWTTSTQWSKWKDGVGDAMRPAFTLHSYHSVPGDFAAARANKQAWASSLRDALPRSSTAPLAPARPRHTQDTRRSLRPSQVSYNEGAYADGTYDPHGYNDYRWVKMPNKIAWFVNERPVAEAWNGGGQVRMRIHNGRWWGGEFGDGLWAPFDDPRNPMFLIFNLAFGSGVSLGGAKDINRFRKNGELDRASMEYVRVWEVAS